MSTQRRIAIVGGGVLGAALAHRLTEAGARVVLLERERPGSGASRWSLAWLNSNARTSHAYHGLRTYSMAEWAKLAERAGGDGWYRPVGNLRWYGDAGRQAEYAAQVGLLREWGYEAELVDRDKATALEPALELPDGVGEVGWFPGEGYVLTERFVDGLLRRAEDAGAEIRTGAAGHAVTVGDGVVGTADGARLHADTVVCCAGRWTPEVTRTAGAEVPVVDPSPPGSESPALVVRAGPVAAPPLRVLHTPLVHMRAHGVDLVHLEAGDTDVDLHTPDGELDRLAALLLDRARAVVPALRGAEVVDRQVCVRPMPLDGLPAVGHVSDRTYAMVTHSGVTLAAGLADLAARELLEDVRLPELAPFRPARFG